MTETRRPRAYRIPTAEAPLAPERPVTLVEEPFEVVEAADGAVVPVARKGFPWGGLLASAAGGLATLAVGLGVERLIASLFESAPWLGWVALALLGLGLVALAALVGREVRGVLRERRVERLRERAIAALRGRDEAEARGVVIELAAFYAARPDLAAARGRLERVGEEILEADDRIGLAERELLAPLDALARARIADAAKQVSAVTALSPRAIVDVAFVVFAAARLLRQIAAIYGGRPGFFGFLALMRAALSHLAVTGGVAVGDSLIQQALGLGLAARVSAKLGEGVLNGLMTARFGLAALAVCRPLPFTREAPPRIGDVAGELLRGAPDEG
jgi:putative membrane protein